VNAETQTPSSFGGEGRDLEEFAVSVKQNDKGRWDVTGPRRGAQPSVEREEIVTALVKGGGPMTIKQIAEAYCNGYDNVKQLLGKMHNEGVVVRTRRGMYQLPEQELPV
jgi:hypothetical protein